MFPAGTTLKATRADRSGMWTDMDHRGVYDDTASYTRRFITLWYDHGISPSGASYSYIQLPGATQATTSAMAASTDISVVANSTAVQAVQRASDGLTMANFWSGSAPKTAGIRVDQPVSVVMSRAGGELSVSVSDPTQRLSGPVTVTIDGAATGTISADSGVTVLATSPAVKLSVDVDGAAGRSFVARLGL